MVQPTPKLLPPRIDKGEATSIDDLCRQISEDNDRRIEGMSEERGERRDIIERFRRDPGDGDNSPLSLRPLLTASDMRQRAGCSRNDSRSLIRGLRRYLSLLVHSQMNQSRPRHLLNVSMATMTRVSHAFACALTNRMLPLCTRKQ